MRTVSAGMLMCTWAATLSLHAAPPRVVEAFPDTADRVDPTTTELRIIFDQDMQPGGRSICGGGDTFPTISGAPRWLDARTFVLPITLQADKAYVLSVNCPAARNFKSVTGEPAEPYAISFATTKAGEAPPTLAPEQAADMLVRLRRLIDERYSHRDLHDIDWPARFEQFRGRLAGAPTPAAFARAAAECLRVNNDLHLTLEVSGVRLATGRRAVAPNYNARTLATIVPNYTPSRTGARGVFDTPSRDGRIGYIAIHTWNADASTQALADLRALGDITGLVVDVRLNSGGDEAAARAFATRFVEGPTVYSRSLIRSPDASGGWDGPFERTVEPAPDATPFGHRVAILIGPACMSSNESFVLMMRRPGQRELFGARTWGSSGNPRPHDLGHAVTVHLPSWRDLAPDGSEVEGRGIEPDHAVPWPSPPPADRDPVLDAALAWLRDH
ncbi:MAG: S41 family peptidase [Planctomycetota bacterium]|nr:S41 family peptidase [Planctomycetota bacterium]